MARRRTTTNGNPSVVIGYIRASIETDQSLGPQAQRAALTRWCDANGVRLASIHEDIGVSGGTSLDNRPGLLAGDGRTLEPEPLEEAVVERIRTLRAAQVPIRGIADRLNAERVPSRGLRWHATTVSRLLRRAG